MRRVGVVVPAKNEEERIAACLTSILASADRLAQTHPRVEVRIVCIADDCTDGTEELAGELARQDPRLSVIAGRFGSVGSARRAGCDTLLDWAARDASPPEHLWMATTDADSTVPPGWLSWQADASDQGWDALVGTVVPKEEDAPPELIARWHELHDLRDGHSWVFGANLGVRASSYLAAGGFCPLSSGEDVRLVRDLEAAGARITRRDGERVLTSARRDGRVLDGFSTYLRDLEAEQRGAGAASPE